MRKVPTYKVSIIDGYNIDMSNTDRLNSCIPNNAFDRFIIHISIQLFQRSVLNISVLYPSMIQVLVLLLAAQAPSKSLDLSTPRKKDLLNRGEISGRKYRLVFDDASVSCEEDDLVFICRNSVGIRSNYMWHIWRSTIE